MASPAAPPPGNSFFNRTGTHRFENPDHGGRKYLPQVNEWSFGTMMWVCERSGGVDHLPQWDAYPVWRGEELKQFHASGQSKQKAKEDAAKQMAFSGHC